MLRVFKDNIKIVWALVLGPCIAVGTRLNDAYTLYNLGLPQPIWEAIGLLLFFGAVVALLIRFQSSHPKPGQVEKQIAPKANDPISTESRVKSARVKLNIIKADSNRPMLEHSNIYEFPPIYQLSTGEWLMLIVFETEFDPLSAEVFINDRLVETGWEMTVRWNRAVALVFQPNKIKDKMTLTVLIRSKNYRG